MNRREALVMLAVALTPVMAHAQGSWPQRPIKILVPVAAGGVTDIVARQWADRVQGALGSMFVENRGGGSGMIAAVEAARAAPDGHTLFVANSSVMVLVPLIASKPRYDPNTDYAHISILATASTAIMVHGKLPVRSLQELIAYAKANPAKLSYATAGTGTMTHLTGELFKQLTGISDIAHVPYKGAGPGIADLVSGHVPMMAGNITGQLLELHRAGAIRILAVGAPERLKGVPEIPTAIEAGVPGMVGQLVTTLSAPAGTPQPIIDRIAAASRKAMGDPQFQKLMQDAGLETVPDSGPEHARKYLADEQARWGPVAKAIGLKLE